MCQFLQFKLITVLGNEISWVMHNQVVSMWMYVEKTRDANQWEQLQVDWRRSPSHFLIQRSLHQDNGHDTNTGGVWYESRTGVCWYSPGPSLDPRGICLDSTLKCATILPESSFTIISFILQRSSISHSFARSAVQTSRYTELHTVITAAYRI